MDSDSIDAIRKADVSRRGGVRVRGGRLPHIQIRNVTNTGQNKKTIAPNIPQRRSKTDGSKSEKPEDNCTKDVHKEFGSKSRGRGGRGRGARVYLQTEGTFMGEGPAFRTQKDLIKPTYERSSTSRSSGPRSKQDTKIDSEMINNLLDCYDEQEAYGNSPDVIAPLRLPMLKVEAKAYKTEEVKHEEEDTKPAIRIKEEPVDDDEISKVLIDRKLLTTIKTENTNIKLEDTKPIILSNGKIFQDDNQMLLLQLPSYLPFSDMKKSSDMDHGKGKSAEKTTNMDDNPKNQASGANVKDVSEGYIGKLQVMRSGRARMVMGSVIFELEQGLEPENVREVASVSVGENGVGSMIVLGRIGRKLILQHDFSNMMDNTEKDKESYVQY